MSSTVPLNSSASPDSSRGLLRLGLGLIALVTVVLGGFPGLESQTAQAQDDGRFVVVLDVTGKKGDSISDDFRRIFSDFPHVVFNQDDYIGGGERQGVTDDRFWDNPGLMAQVSQGEGIDAVVAGHMERTRKKRYELTVFVFEARTGEIMGEFTIKLGKKARLSSSKRGEVGELANQFVIETGKVEIKPQSVSITINSTPQGASVLRDGVELGKTPLEIERDYVDTTELWELTYGGRPAGVAKVDLTSDNSYTVALKGIEDIEDPDGDGGGSDGGGGSSAGGVSGNALPIFEIGISTDLAGRILDVETKDDTVGLSYSSSAYPIFKVALDFFPATLFSSNGYLAGIGLHAYGGYASLQSQIPLLGQWLAVPGVFDILGENTECGGSAEGDNFIECPTVHSEFGFGASYVLLLQSLAGGGLDPEGMALRFDVLYTWLQFDVGSNPTYEGHGYQGLEFAAGYGMPLGLDGLRIAADLAFTQVLTFGESNMIATWGTSASGFGFSGGLKVSWEFFAGLFAEIGYQGQYFSTTYEGVGCQRLDDTMPCTSQPEASAASDQYHRGTFRFGYRLF